jgi:hypothetical protein
LERYIADPVLRRRHGLAARTRALDRFTPRLVWEALRSHYQELLVEAR